MGIEPLEDSDLNPISEPGSAICRCPVDLVTEAIRRDLATLAGLPGLEQVESTYLRKLNGPAAA